MRIKRIDSPSNSIFKDLSLLTSSKGITKQKKALISGEKILSELLPQISNNGFFIYHSEHHSLFERLGDTQLLVLRKDLYDELDVVGTKSPLLCIDTPPFKNWDPKSELQTDELMCALGDPSNLGAVIRSAAAFGFKKIVLLQEAANVFLPKVTKSSSGCNMILNFEYGPSIRELEGTEHLAALDMMGADLRTMIDHKPRRWLLGQEGLGVPHTLSCEKVTIPIANTVESLNAAVSASILMYHLQTHRGR
jgi:RNA methyltransferase, TrmH family